MGGIGTLVGPIAGAAFFLLLREGLSRYFEYYLIPVGIIFMLMVIFLPQGFLGFLRRRPQPVTAGPGPEVSRRMSATFWMSASTVNGLSRNPRPGIRPRYSSIVLWMSLER